MKHYVVKHFKNNNSILGGSQFINLLIQKPKEIYIHSIFSYHLETTSGIICLQQMSQFGIFKLKARILFGKIFAWNANRFGAQVTLKKKWFARSPKSCQITVDFREE